MEKIKELNILTNYHIELVFDDGFTSVLNLKPFLGKGFTKELLDLEKFNTLHIEEGGGIAFANGYDFCPNYLRELSEKLETAEL